MGVIYNHLLKKVPSKVLGNPVLVDIQNVADFVVANVDSVPDSDDMNAAPPWEYALFEWNIPFPNDFKAKSERSEFFSRHGLLFDSYKMDEGGWSFEASLYLASEDGRVYEYFRYDGVIGDDGVPGKMFVSNAPDFQGDEVAVNVLSGEISYEGPPNPVDAAEKRELLLIRYSYLRMVLMALTFANCHNVKVIDTVPQYSRQVRRSMERRGESIVVYKTLSIPGTTVRYESTSEADGSTRIVRKMHMCRGHFAHYENLFGRLGPRTVWVPLHVKGNATHGVVVKDYKVGV